MVQLEAKILMNEKVGPQRYKMVLSAPEIARQAQPGQFVHVRVCEGYNPLLRRPFSIHRVKSRKIEIIYKVVGKGTDMLSRKKNGEYLDVLGPLGTGYRSPSPTAKISDVILVAGGIGVASLLFLAESLSVTSSELSILAIIGAKDKDELLCEGDFKRLGCRVEIATENGTKGYRGLASDLFQECLPLSSDIVKPLVFACGPLGMLKNVGEISKKRHFPCQVSLEEHLACGVGACLGCVVKVKGSNYNYKRVCRDGPVFDAGELVW